MRVYPKLLLAVVVLCGLHTSYLVQGVREIPLKWPPRGIEIPSNRNYGKKDNNNDDYELPQDDLSINQQTDEAVAKLTLGDDISDATMPAEAKNPAAPPQTVKNKPAAPQNGNKNPVAPQTGNNNPTPPQTGNNKPAAPQTGNNKPAAPQTGNNNPAAPQTGNNNPAAPQTGNNNPAAPQTGGNNPSAPQTADYNQEVPSDPEDNNSDDPSLPEDSTSFRPDTTASDAPSHEDYSTTSDEIDETSANISYQNALMRQQLQAHLNNSNNTKFVSTSLFWGLFEFGEEVPAEDEGKHRHVVFYVLLGIAGFFIFTTLVLTCLVCAMAKKHRQIMKQVANAPECESEVESAKSPKAPGTPTKDSDVSGVEV